MKKGDKVRTIGNMSLPTTLGRAIVIKRSDIGEIKQVRQRRGLDPIYYVEFENLPDLLQLREHELVVVEAADE